MALAYQYRPSPRRVRRERIDTALLETDKAIILTMSFRRDPAMGLLYSLSADEIDRGAVAGNGGVMAEVKKLKTTNKRGTANLTKVRGTCEKPLKRVKKSTPEKSTRDSEYDALDVSDSEGDELDAEDVICTKLNRVLVKRSTYIAKKLVQRAEEGSVTGANLVLQLVRRTKQAKKLRLKRLTPYVDRLETDEDAAKSGKQES